MIVQNGVCVIVQARLGSKRLPKKAVLKLDERTLLDHVLASLAAVEAQVYILACDYASEKTFYPIAERYNFFTVAGSEQDVLSRFALATKKAEAISSQQNFTTIKCIVRATGDNPFLFTECITDSVKRFFELDCPDYFTFTGLPHGSGVELFSVKGLLEAQATSTNAYEREHVGPALYYHREKYRVIYETAPQEYYFPELRTTIDTEEDLIRTQHALAFLKKNEIKLPARALQIVNAIKYSTNSLIFIPLIQHSQGSGHLRRAIELAEELQSTVRVSIFVQKDNIPEFAKRLLESVNPDFIIHELPKSAKLIILDNFQTSRELITKLQKIAPVLALDEGGEARENADYIFDIIPSLSSRTTTPPNRSDIACIPLPENRKAEKPDLSNTGKRLQVLVSCGGEDRQNMSIPIGLNISELPFNVTVISPETSFSLIKEMQGKIRLLRTVPNLREQLFQYDIVITIFGFTAFEALAAGCYVVLVSPSEYHYQLACEYGFSCFPPGIPTTEELRALLKKGIHQPSLITQKTQQVSLAKEILKIANSTQCACPVCEEEEEAHEIVARLHDRTISKCPKTNLCYLSFIMSSGKNYNENYFFEEYKNQYGKTYLEDFDNIMEQGKRRLEIIDECFSMFLDNGASRFEQEKNLLDIGCAYGAFLKTCERSDWFAVGTDISTEAISYVTDRLKLPGFVSAFPLLPEYFTYWRQSQLALAENAKAIFPLQNESFQAITMWFVIEHFRDLNSVLNRVADLLVPGGIFAFSTPTISGISGKQDINKFFQNSPSDHYSLFDFESVQSVMELYGFKIIKTISVGHHPERFKHFANVKKDSLVYRSLFGISRKFKLGDTMEIYAIKRQMV